MMLIDPSHLSQKDHFTQIVAQGVPISFQGSALELNYPASFHGISLQGLFNRVKATSPSLVAIRDSKERLFGCYATAP